MNKTTISIGILMLTSAAAGIYFDDLAIRIIAGVVFLIGALLLYYTFASIGDSEQEDAVFEENESITSQHSRQNERDEQFDFASRKTTEPAHQDKSALTENTSERSGILSSRVHESEDIPVEYYRDSRDSVPFQDPRSEFDFLTNRLLQVLKEHLIANTVALFWINQDRQQIVIGEYVSDSKHFTTARRLSLGTDIVSQIGSAGKPRILSEIAPLSEHDLLVYYDADEGIQSFVGVPLFFMDEVIAVLAADSKAPDTFGLETISAIGKFTSLISLLLSSYNQKFDLAADSKLLDVLARMRTNINQQMDLYGVASAAAKAIKEILDWDFLAVILYYPEKQDWTVIRSQSKASNIPYISEGVSVHIGTSVFRKVLDDLQSHILQAPRGSEFRFHEREVISSTGQICVTPMVKSGRCLGLLVVEYRENHQYVQKDLDVLGSIADLAATFITAIQLQELTRKYLLIDEITRVSSRGLLFQRLTEEIQRIKAFNGNAVFFLLGIDSHDQLLQKYGQDGFEIILQKVAKILKESIQAYDVLGKYDPAKFGILLINTNAEEAYLRGEKIRKMIAGTVISINGASFTVTVSFAGCVFGQGMEADQVLKVSQQAMERAIADGGNCVKVV